ncbi:hypothetical protein BS47DRAFT_581511 [Hydnum rufescens UP504]|uniref:Uncharacterized protein n=1 Tax=Hydnum rufescens UP504 TaxID=1448309 RepID=A0A9P6AHJ5_9AGAM|nr:hypothetical protein BS47DRAFT_581511 [Hydnum rufescens UP504]
MMQHSSDTLPKYVCSVDNRADAPSRKQHLSDDLRLPHFFKMPSTLACYLPLFDWFTYDSATARASATIQQEDLLLSIDLNPCRPRLAGMPRGHAPKSNGPKKKKKTISHSSRE